jgi:tetratricopeptide (TPR) repeat protein
VASGPRAVGVAVGAQFLGILFGVLLSVAFPALSVRSSDVTSQIDSTFHFVGTRGPYAVGLRVVDQYDYSRTFEPATDILGKPYVGERARPIQTLVWYPSAPGQAKPMTVRAYASLAMTGGALSAVAREDEADSWFRGMSPNLAMKLWAGRDANALAGRFPVVVYAPSFSGPSWENADLCEYLASYGYVVVAGPSMGLTGRKMTRDHSGIDAQARDISFLLGYAQSLPNTNMSAVAVVGFSWGGLSNLFAAARDHRIGALIALDGSMRYFPALVRNAGDVHPDQMVIPLLYVSQGNFSLEDQDRYTTEPEREGPNVLNEWRHGDLIHVRMTRMIHTEFGSMLQRREDVWSNLGKYNETLEAGADRSDGIIGYAWVARYTLSFLDAYLKHDARAMAFLQKTPEENGVPKYLMEEHYRAAAGAAPSLDGFRAEIGRRGFDHASEIYAAMRRDKPDFKLDEQPIESWATELMKQNHESEAIALLKMLAQIFPQSTTAWLNLGDAYEKAGDRQLAIDTFKEVLQKDPFNADAREELSHLEGAR